MTRALHLKSAVTALPDGTVVGYSPVVDDPAFFPHFRSMPEEGGAHVVDLGGGPAADGRLARPARPSWWPTWATTPVVVDIAEFEKLEGCVTCLSVRLRAAQRRTG